MDLCQTIAMSCPQCSEALPCPPRVVEHEDDMRYCPGCKLPLVLVAGKYRLERWLGEGGNGVVYLARHQDLSLAPLRVIKFLKRKHFGDENVIERFRREIHLTASISQSNDHIVRIYDDFGVIPKLGHFYVMEYLKGNTLEEFLESETPSISTLVHILKQLCMALAAAHRENVIHRDVKPSNIIVIQRSDDPYFIKVMDFGLAKTFSPDMASLTVEGIAPGTPMYMSPEQFMGKHFDHRADIYAVGLILYEMLTGQSPFAQVLNQQNNISITKLAHAHILDVPTPPSEICPERSISPLLDQITLRCIEKNPIHRYQTMAELLKELEQLQQELSPIEISREEIVSDNPTTTPPREDLLPTSRAPDTTQNDIQPSEVFQQGFDPTKLSRTQLSPLPLLPNKAPRRSTPTLHENVDYFPETNSSLPSAPVIASTTVLTPMPLPFTDDDADAFSLGPSWKMKSLSFAAGAGLLLLAFFFLGSNPSSSKQVKPAVAPSTQKQKPKVPSQIERKKTPIRTKPERVPPRRLKVVKQQKSRRPKVETQQKTRRTKAVKKQKVRRRHRVRSRRRSRSKQRLVAMLRVKPTPSITKRSKTPGCPADQKDAVWMRIKVYPKHARLNIKQPFQKLNGWYCIKRRHHRQSVRVRIKRAKYFPCLVNRAFTKRDITLRLRREPKDQLTDEPDVDYCLR